MNVMTKPPAGNRRLHIPEPAARPGDAPDFAGARLQPAGAAPRPDPLCGPLETRDHAFGLVRVLDDAHKAVGPWDPKLDPEILREGLRHMVVNRIMDDRMLKLQRQGKMSFYMKALGEEAVSVAPAMALRPDDMAFTSYRQQGVLLARGRDIVDMMCHCISNSRDNLKGRQLPVHYASREHHFWSISGNLATQVPQAVGWAMASQYRGSDQVTATWIGDGATAEGDFHIGCTMAGVYKAPVIFFVHNNQWAISTFSGIANCQETTFAAKGVGYGLPALRVDGNDFLATFAATQWAATRARAGLGATLIELFTYRAEAHSTSDDPARYRPKEEPGAWPLGDPVDRLKGHLIGLQEWSEEQHKALEEETVKLVTKSYKEAESYGTLHEGPLAPTPTMFDDVYKEQTWRLRRQRQELGV